MQIETGDVEVALLGGDKRLVIELTIGSFESLPGERVKLLLLERGTLGVLGLNDLVGLLLVLGQLGLDALGVVFG